MTTLKMAAVSIWNVLVFLSCVIPQGIPVYKWPHAWRIASEAHEREIRQMLTELTMTGKVKRRIEDGHFVYYPLDKD